MKPQKFRWSRVYESSEEELVGFLRAKQITAERWSAEEFQAFKPRQFDRDMTIWCAEGSLHVRVADATISLQPGDALLIPANIDYSLDAGMAGCVCYDSH